MIRMKRYQFSFPKTAIVGILKALEPVKKWKKEYSDETIVFDGYGWGITTLTR